MYNYDEVKKNLSELTINNSIKKLTKDQIKELVAKGLKSEFII